MSKDAEIISSHLPSLNKFLCSEAPSIVFEKDPHSSPDFFCSLLHTSLYRYCCAFIFVIQKWVLLSSLKIFIYKKLGVKIGKNTYMGPSVQLDSYYPDLVSIGDNCLIGIETIIATHELSHRRLKIGRVTIGNNVTIGAYSLIKCGITIGDNAEIGMGSVVLRDVPPGATVTGNPARTLKMPPHQEN